MTITNSIFRWSAGILSALVYNTAAGQETKPAPSTANPRDVKILHIESSTYFLGTLNFHHHSRTAHRIDNWRNNGHVTAELWDTHPFEPSPWNLEALRDYDVITVSSLGSVDSTSQYSTFDRNALNRAWAESGTVVVLAGGNDGNSLCARRWNPDSEEEIHKAARSIYTYGDTVLRVGALENGHIACYSSENAPDFVYKTAFEEGFCDNFYMTQAEIDAEMAKLNPIVAEAYRQSLPKEVFTANPAADHPQCNITGTSFVAPNGGRIVANLLSEYPTLHEYELMATALLATSPVDYGNNPAAIARQSSEYTVVNGRGLRSDRISGFGAYSPDKHRQLIERLLTLRDQNSGVTTPVRLESTGRFTRVNDTVAGHTSYKVHINDPGTIMRTVLEIRLKMDRGKDFFQQSIPEEIILVSPSGAQMKMIAIDDMNTLTDSKGYQLMGTATAFFGEEAQGDWTIVIPNKANGARHTVLDIKLGQWSVKHGGPIDKLLDQVTRPLTAAPAPAPATPAPRP